MSNLTCFWREGTLLKNKCVHPKKVSGDYIWIEDFMRFHALGCVHKIDYKNFNRPRTMILIRGANRKELTE